MKKRAAWRAPSRWTRGSSFTTSPARGSIRASAEIDQLIIDLNRSSA